jgi:hypothetical protein
MWPIKKKSPEIIELVKLALQNITSIIKALQVNINKINGRCKKRTK